jgi:hypothetical protein
MMQLNKNVFHLNLKNLIKCSSSLKKFSSFKAFYPSSKKASLVNFSRGIKTAKTPKTDLASVLSQEILEETSNDSVDAELESSKKLILKDFTINDNPGSGVVKYSY